MSIEIKASKDLLFNRDTIYYLYINGKKYKHIFVKHKGTLVNEDYPKGDMLQKIQSFNCMQLPEKLRTGYLLDGKYHIPMRQGFLDYIAFSRKGNNFIVKATWVFLRKQVMDAYFNPAMLLKLTAEYANKMGMKNCAYYDSGTDSEDATFYYHSKAEGTIGNKIEEAIKQLNKAMKKAEAEMLMLMKEKHNK